MTKKKHHFQLDSLSENYADVVQTSFADVQHVVPVIDGHINLATGVLHRSLIR